MEIYGQVTKAPAPVEGATQKEVELQVQQIYVVSLAAPTLPFQVCARASVPVWVVRSPLPATLSI